MTDYTILTSATATGLAHLVQDYISNGWRPQGGVSYDTNRKEFLQAMVRP